jgi:Putative transmembrane protein (Alph_Pro_TM)
MTGSKALIFLLMLLASPLRAGDLSVRLTPPTIEMGTFYDGATVRVEGECESGTKVIVIVKGADVAELFNVKGRVGPVWLNTGKARISGVPSLFLLFSPQPVSDFLGAEAVGNYGLDAEALQKRLQIEPKTLDSDLIRLNFLKLKTGEDLYRLVSGAVKMGQPGANGVPYAVEFPWPKKAPPGSYKVQVYECRNGSVVQEAGTPLHVLEVGFPAFMASLARDHASLYGVLAVFTTMLAGFGIDFIVARSHRRKRPAPASRIAGVPVPTQQPTPASPTPESGVPPSRPRSAA